MELDERFEKVCDPESFLDFVRALAADSVEHEAEWENASIEAFLEAAVARATDTPSFGRRQDENEASLWKEFARFLYCGKYYE